ncbi:MAG: hypothetical protein AB8B93_13080 [Pseudomonadales bacterium]
MGSGGWLIASGLGALWLGLQIIWVAPTPRQLRRGPVPSAEPGSDAAFMLFWIDQYGWLGLTLAASGALLALIGAFL